MRWTTQECVHVLHPCSMQVDSPAPSVELFPKPPIRPRAVLGRRRIICTAPEPADLVSGTHQAIACPIGGSYRPVISARRPPLRYHCPASRSREWHGWGPAALTQALLTYPQSLPATCAMRNSEMTHVTPDLSLWIFTHFRLRRIGEWN